MWNTNNIKKESFKMNFYQKKKTLKTFENFDTKLNKFEVLEISWLNNRALIKYIVQKF